MQAQRRFRERQKSLIGDLRESVSTLTRETEAQSKQIFVLQVCLRRPVLLAAKNTDQLLCIAVCTDSIAFTHSAVFCSVESVSMGTAAQFPR